MIDNIILYNTLGWVTFPADKNSKEPACTDWPERKPDPIAAAEEEQRYLRAGAYGVVLKPDDLVIDIDPRNFVDGVNPWHKLREYLNLPKIKAPAVKTGGGGVHIYFKKPADVELVYRLKDFPGMEIKTGMKNSYVIGPGSGHESGNKYEFIGGHDLADVPQAPAKLIEFLTKTAGNLSETGSGFTGGEAELKRYVSWLKQLEPAVEGQGGDEHTFKAAVKGRDFGLRPKDVLLALLEHFNPRCTPPWSEDELKLKIRNAYKYATGAPGSLDPSLAFSETAEVWDNESDETRKWDTDKNGRISKTLRNAINFLYLRPELRGAVVLNQFTGDIEMKTQVPWWDKRTPGDMWSDTDVVLLKYHLIKKTGIEFSTQILWEALHSAAIRFSYHPIREYILSTPWDGEKRLDSWLHKYCGVPDNAYTAAVGRKTLLGMVARVFVPGIKFDYCPIFEGAQGIGKSTVCHILGGKWYGDIVLDPHARDTIDAIRGKWIVELSEMEVTRRAEAQALKAFISRTTDRARLAYARSALDFPRQCIFIGTINPDELGYLSDTTGNRRFWPFKCGDKIDIPGLKSVRDQLFAEAYAAFSSGEELYLKGDLIKLAEIEQEERMGVDPWEDVIATWLDTVPGLQKTNITEIWELALGGQARNMKKIDQIRIGRVLKRLGLRKCRGREGEKRMTVYRREVLDIHERLEELGVM